MMLPSLLSVLEVLDAAIVLADKIRFSIGVHKAARSEVRSFFSLAIQSKRMPR